MSVAYAKPFSLAPHWLIPVPAVWRPFCSGHFGYGRNKKNGLGISPCRTCVPIFVQIRARLDTQIAETHAPTQFGGHFAAAILITAETKKQCGRIAMPDVRANFRPNPCTFRYSKRGDARTQGRAAHPSSRSLAAILQLPFWLQPNRKDVLGVSPCRMYVLNFVQIRAR